MSMRLTGIKTVNGDMICKINGMHIKLIPDGGAVWRPVNTEIYDLIGKFVKVSDKPLGGTFIFHYEPDQITLAHLALLL